MAREGRCGLCWALLPCWRWSGPRAQSSQTPKAGALGLWVLTWARVTKSLCPRKLTSAQAAETVTR